MDLDQTEQRPNNLLIVADQYRHDYSGYAGSAFVDTPNIDGLAKGGVVVSQCTTNSPLCGPSRAALASGRRPHRLGILNKDSYLPLSRTTLYRRLRDHGCWTGLIGKPDVEKGSYQWRGAGPDSRTPVMSAYGFCDHIHASAGMTVPEEPRMAFHHYLQVRGLYRAYYEDRCFRKTGNWCVGVNRDSQLPAEHHTETYIGSKACEWISNTPEQWPWFLQLRIDGPHDLFDPPTEYSQRYRDRPMPKAIPPDRRGKPDWVKNRKFTDDASGIRIARQQYCPSFELIDHQIGRLVDSLKATGQQSNTIVIFT